MSRSSPGRRWSLISLGVAAEKKREAILGASGTWSASQAGIPFFMTPMPMRISTGPASRSGGPSQALIFGLQRANGAAKDAPIRMEGARVAYHAADKSEEARRPPRDERDAACVLAVTNIFLPFRQCPEKSAEVGYCERHSERGRKDIPPPQQSHHRRHERPSQQRCKDESLRTRLPPTTYSIPKPPTSRPTRRK